MLMLTLLLRFAYIRRAANIFVYAYATFISRICASFFFHIDAIPRHLRHCRRD